MLVTLQVRDFAIVDRIEVEFEPGMTVLTGETGAARRKGLRTQPG